MQDLTLLYYTANTIADDCGEKIRKTLLDTTGGCFPIVSVSQKPIQFGDVKLCVGVIGQSAYNCYKQIFLGVLNVKTKYVACVEDDTIYNMEHFNMRPSLDDVIAYNLNMWFVERLIFWNRNVENKIATGMCCCIAPTEALKQTLAERFEKHPVEPLPHPDTPAELWEHDKKRIQSNWQEPGRFDGSLGIKKTAIEYFRTETPVVVLNRHGSLGGRRKNHGLEKLHKDSMPHLGKAGDVWSYYMGGPCAKS